ncbi:MAG: archaea-specific SMC-related protein [Halorhabdus sp.]
MSVPAQQREAAVFTVENIGGISQTDVEIPPGVTVLKGSNATNRTSFLQAIMAAMGSEKASLKADADRGCVTLSIGDREYERTLERAGSSVHYEGEGFLDDPTVADLFAFLHETNEARQAVARGEDLRELIMRPIDVEEIKREIERLTEEKGEINDELATIESRKRDLPALEQRRTSIKDDIEARREELADLEAEIDESSADIEESRQVKEELEDTLEELRSVRSQLDTARRDIEAQQDSISSLKRDQTELEEELADLPSSPATEDEHLSEQIETLRERRQTLNAEISDLQSLITYNRDRLEEADYELFEAFGEPATEDGAITDQLVENSDDEEVVCWTCGSTVQRSQIEGTIDRLEGLREEKVQQLNHVKTDLEEYKSQRREIERKQRRRDEIDASLDDIDSEIARRTQRIETLKEQREALTEEIEQLEAEVENYESADFEEILSLHREANQLEFEIDSLESDLEDMSEEIEEIESMIERAEDLRAERETLVDALTETRTKIDQVEQDAVEAFNEHMDAIRNILKYENLDRIWIERVEETIRNGRETIRRTAFELHVVRTTENDVAYEDTVNHLSESEREVTGLVFALAGYLVHDLHEEVPFMLLDSLEAIDSNRIARLIEYFAEYATYLVVSLLPEDAQAVDEEYPRITSI